MIYRNFKECKLSMLGFGTMRLPQTPDKQIDIAAARLEAMNKQ